MNQERLEYRLGEKEAKWIQMRRRKLLLTRRALLAFTIPKGDIMIESGESLEIFCVLNKSIDIAANRSARDLIFLRDNKVVPSEFLEIINETTVRLYVKQPPPSESMYYCKLQTPADEIKPGQSRDTAVCLNKVFVGTKPQEVKNFTCISQNWQNLTCSWEKPENFVKTKYKLRYRFPGRAGGRMQYGCPSNTDETSNYCFWNDSTDPHYRLPYAYYYYNLTGENQFGNTSFSHKFHHYGHVIPAPPTDLIVSGTTHDSVLLNWSIPYAMHTFPPGLIHKVVYQADAASTAVGRPSLACSSRWASQSGLVSQIPGILIISDEFGYSIIGDGISRPMPFVEHLCNMPGAA
uniref:(California timema) hypothetical protein n=1 Tax=Timema californicum TaxID=61474 RepID=A0A7R9J454_TIMCA|nr:unnamed protein product [Timema californicum]